MLPQILHLVTERRHARMQISHAHRGRAHIDTAAILSEVERRADDGDVGTGHFSIVPTGYTGTGETNELRDGICETLY